MTLRRPHSKLGASRAGGSLWQAVILSIVTLAPGTSSEAHALGFRRMDGAVRKLPRSHVELALHPYQQAKAGLSLNGVPHLGFEEAAKRALREYMSNSLVEMRTRELASGLSLTTGTRTLDIQYAVAGVPICGAPARAHQLSSGETMLLADVPQLDAHHPVPDGRASSWPDLELTLEHLADAHPGSKVVPKQTKRCWLVNDGKLMPVWEVIAAVDGMPWRALGDAYELIELDRQFFDVTGKAMVFPQNSLTGTMSSFDLPELVGDGSLTSVMLRSYVPDGYSKAKEPSHVFNYAASDARYGEVASYTHAQLHFDYLKAMGFEWYGPKPMEVRVHVKPQGRSNNALFIPGSTDDGSLPTIMIDDGDGKDLQNLVTDADVVSHEFGHHVIYRTLQETQGQSLVLHEGLADFFAFSRTGNSCLGESICPAGSSACIVESQCLRTADNQIVYNDAIWKHWAGTSNRLGHLHGQLISALLWELRAREMIAPDDLAKLTLKAVSFFKGNSGFRDFMLALFLADQELFGLAHAKGIKEVGEARGLGEFFADVDLTAATIPLTSGQDGTGGGSTGATQEKNKSGGGANPFPCGILAEGPSQGSPVAVWLALALPLGLVVHSVWLARRPQKVLARSRKLRK